MATASQRLIERLRTMGLDLPADTVVKRTGYGSANRARGAWTWRLVHDGDDIFFRTGSHQQSRPIGSGEPVTALAKAERLAVLVDGSDLTVTPLAAGATDRHALYQED